MTRATFTSSPAATSFVLGLADIASLSVVARRALPRQSVNVQIEEFRESGRHAFDRLREAIDEEVDTVLDLSGLRRLEIRLDGSTSSILQTIAIAIICCQCVRARESH